MLMFEVIRLLNALVFQDLPNYAQHTVPIFSLPQEWLWCESWCGNATKSKAKTIDLCNNPMTKEPKLQVNACSLSCAPSSCKQLNHVIIKCGLFSSFLSALFHFAFTNFSCDFHRVLEEQFPSGQISTWKQDDSPQKSQVMMKWISKSHLLINHRVQQETVLQRKTWNQSQSCEYNLHSFSSKFIEPFKEILRHLS